MQERVRLGDGKVMGKTRWNVLNATVPTVFTVCLAFPALVCEPKRGRDEIATEKGMRESGRPPSEGAGRMIIDVQFVHIRENEM